MKYRDLIREVEDHGWVKTGQVGSHRHFEHATKPGKVTIPGKPNEDVHPKTLKSIRRQAGLLED
jgi:predicted RNA binding protein YcfA (HicA-like mRNA interferase family)